MTAPGTMQLNRALAFLCLVISVGAQRNHRLTCYLDVLTHRTREGPCTHIILPSISSDEDLYRQSLSEDERIILRKMKERNPTLKILLGLEVRSSRLELMSANEGTQGSVENFTQTVLAFLKDKSLDGLDVIWQDGLTSDASTRSSSQELFSNFLKSLKGTFGKEPDPLLLSVSLLDPTDNSAVSYDEQTLSQYVDFISILPAHLENDGRYINKSVQHWQDQHVDLQKLNLVMPGFLQRSRRRHHQRRHPTHDDMNSEGKKNHIHVLGSYMGGQVCQVIKSGQEQFITLTILSDEHSLVKEVLQEGFGGIGVVFIDLDVFVNSICVNLNQDERAIVESKVIMPSHHGRDGHHHRRGHHHSHQHHRSSHLPHGSHDTGHHHHRHHPHRHGHHHHRHHHHHHPHPITPQSNMTREQQQGVE
ncbi:uncharacterized protein LOC143725738 [Siphateles boraxobius]|uniref:uncharacterized protein LOC143725738 n=1 Tax=Siphateles boraxobius TaxID=180520 RepID=UPI00406464AD